MHKASDAGRPAAALKESTGGWTQRGKEGFVNAFYLWCAVFFLVLFPLDLLFQIDALAKTLSFLGVARLSAGVVVIFSGFAVLIAIGSGAAAGLPLRCKGVTAPEAVTWLNVLLASTFSLQVVMQIFLFWLAKLANRGSLAASEPAILVAVGFAVSLLLMTLKHDYAANFLTHAKRAKGPVTAMATVSLLTAVYAVSSTKTQYQESVAVATGLQGSSKTKPNIILISFDALSAKHMSLYGYRRETTPNLEEFARSAYLFTNMISNGNWTIPSTASIITGKYPLTHRIGFLTPDVSAPFREQNLAASLKKAGYQTAMVTGNLLYANPKKNGTFPDFDIIYDKSSCGVETAGINNSLMSHFYLMDVNLSMYYARMYGTYLVPYKTIALLPRQLLAPAKVTAPGSTDFALFNSAKPHFEEASKILRRRKKPMFLWCHVFPPHAPYIGSPRYLYRFRKEHVLDSTAKIAAAGSENYQIMSDRYDELLLSVDDEFGALLRELKEQGLFENSIVIVTADHGEVFSESFVGHGGHGSINLLPSALIHVPLAIHLPGQHARGVVNSPAEQVDLAPTLLDYLGMQKPGWMEGESLRPMMERDAVSRKPKVSMNIDEDGTDGPIRRGIVAVMMDGYKLIHDFRKNSVELYCLKDDPQEETDLAERDPDRVRALDALIRERIVQSKTSRQATR